jgi:hypothetical protein
VFVNAHDTSLVGWIEKIQKGKNYGRNTEGSNQPYDRGSVNGAGPYFTFSTPMKDDTGRVVATCRVSARHGRASSPSTRTQATSRGRYRSA